MKPPKKTKEDNLKKLYKQKLKEKGQALLEYYTKYPQLTKEDIKQLNDSSKGKYGWSTEAYEDFFALKRTYLNQRSEYGFIRTTYIYNYYILSCYLYLNKTVQIPWDIIFHWEEIDVTNPLYKNWSIDALVKETPLDYIEVKLSKAKQYNALYDNKQGIPLNFTEK